MNPIELNYTIDLGKKYTQVQELDRLLFFQDQNAYKINATVKRNGVDEDISGMTCHAYIVYEAINTTYVLEDCGIEGNTAWAILDEKSLLTTGRVYILLRLSDEDNDFVLTTFAAYGDIRLGITDTIFVPSGGILDINALITKIEEFEELIEDVEDAVSGAENVNVSVSKVGDTATITITNRDGTQSVVTLTDPAGDLVQGVTRNGDTITVTKKDGSTSSFVIPISDMQSLVQSVTENEGTVTITKKDGTTSTFEIPQGLAFDGGYCAPDPLTGKTKLYLTAGGVELDTEVYEPIELPDAGMQFDGGFSAEDPEDGKWYLHLTMDDVELDPELFTPIELPAGGGGGGGSSIVISNLVRPTVIRNGADAVFSFTATSSDSTGITVEWYVNGRQITYDEGESGDSFTFNAKNYLNESTANTVRAVITSEGGGSLNRQWTVTTVAFSLAWGPAISPITLYTANENIYAVVVVQAQAGTTNTVTIAVGEHEVERSVTGSRTLTVELDKAWFEIGPNTVTASMVATDGSGDQADDITFVAMWAYGATDPIVAFAEDTLNATQYDKIAIRYMVYDPSSETAECSIQVGSEEAREIIADRTMRTFNYVYAEDMEDPVTLTVTLTCEEVSDTMSLVIAVSPYSIGKVTGDALRYDLDPVGHSNDDADRASFGGLTFSSGFDWVNGGFQTDANGAPAFVVKKGHRATMPRSVFADSDGNGKVIDISFRVTNSDQYDTIAMQDLNNSSTKGIILRANEGEVRLDNAAGQVFRYCEDNRIDLSIHVEGQVEQRIVTIWLDGIPSKVDAYDILGGTLVHTDNPMVIGSDHCDVWVYAIRCYNTALEESDMVQNYIASGSTTADKIDRFEVNNIFDSNSNITPATLHAAVPNLTIIQIAAERMTTNKKDKVPADISITDGTTTLELSADDGTVFMVQGTSSAAYGRSSYNMDLDFKKTGKKYKISENAIPVNYINIKVNVASSENANNINAVDWYNTFQPFHIEAHDRPGVRDSVEGKPCAVFFTNTSNAPAWFSSQLLQPGETVLYAMGDLCNSKKNTDVFGEDMVGEHPTLACVEVSGNDTAPERFLTDQDFEYNDDEEGWVTLDGYDDQGEPKYIMHYEWRMAPDDDHKADVVDAWEDMVSWLVSTIGNPTKFKNEVNNYFTINTLLYHFLMIEFFAAYDNVSKNTFYSYDWDASQNKYLWNPKEAYDWDTILAADNDGKPFGDYGLDYGDTVNGQPGGRSYFNAVDNTIWVNIKAAFQSELSALYITLRSQGAWNAQDVITKWDTYQSKRPHAAMVRDAYIKYVYPYKTSGMVIDGETKSYDDSYLPRMQGSKTYWRRQFMTYQQAYMDGKYGYYSTSNAIAFRTNGASGQKDFEVKVYAKTYITVLADANKVAAQKIQTGGTTTFLNVSVGSNTTLYFTPARLVQYIRPLNETDNSTFVNAGAEKLMEVILGSEDENSAWLSGTGLTIPSTQLQNLSIRNLVNFSSALNLTQNVGLITLDTRGTNTGRITLPSYAPITTLRLNACSGLSALNLKNVTTFDIDSGANLLYFRVENCNVEITSQILDLLDDATNLQNLRLLNVNWILQDTTLLNRLLTIGSISDSGAVGDPPCVLTGSVYVPTVLNHEWQAYQAAWPGVVTYGQLVMEYPVIFLNWDDSVIRDIHGAPYVQYVQAGGSSHDPILSGEVNTPTRPDDEQYMYTFYEWDDLPVGVIAGATVHATYTRDAISYTVQWYDGIGVGDGTMLEQATGLAFGDSVQPTNPFPTYTAMESNNVYYVFNGWDASTGFVKSIPNSETPYVIKVHAKWIIGNLPSGASNPGLNNMSWAERYAVAKNKMASSYWEPAEYMDFTMGHGDDYEFTNVESLTLIDTPTYFNGGTPIIYNGENDLPLLQLFNGSIERWTLAIDYECTSDTGTIISCYAENGNQGFNLRRNGNYVNILWGDQNRNVEYRYNRGMLVIRYNRGHPLILYVTGDGNLEEGACPIDTAHPETNVANDAIVRNVAPETNAPLTIFGIGNMNGSDISSVRATGWIHWAKFWYDDIGTDNSKSIAAMPHIPARYMYTGIEYRDGLESSTLVGAGFQSVSCLPNTHPWNKTNTNVGGWAASHLNAWLNGQFFDGLPIPLQTIIKPARVKSTVGGGTSQNPAYEIQSSMCKVYAAAKAEADSTITGTTPSNIAFIDECDDFVHRIPFVVDPNKGQTNIRHTRLQWPGLILPDDTNYIYLLDTDPSTPGLDYEIHNLKTIWLKAQDSYYQRGWVYVDADTFSKHKFFLGGLYNRSTDYILSASGPDSEGHSGGKWVIAGRWWLRSPNHTTIPYVSQVSYNGIAGDDYEAYQRWPSPAFSL